MSPLLQPGDPAPWFIAASSTVSRFVFNTVAGRYVVLLFLGSAAEAASAGALACALTHRHLFDDAKIALFGVTTDPEDERQGRLRQMLPGIRHFWDWDGQVSRLYGALSGANGDRAYRPFWLVLDPSLRVIAAHAIEEGEAVMRLLAALPPPEIHAGVQVSAPVLVLPRVFERAFCQQLIALYTAHGGEDSGFMRERDGKTALVHDYSHKRRRDYVIADAEARRSARARVQGRILPEIAKVFQFRVTRMERYIVACYDSATGGYFRPHRDNTTKGTAHRRFAVTINLNAEEYQGGDLRFPEFGSRTYRAPTGAAVVFSCSLLHEATPVTQGRRFAFLPFLYDEAAAKQREANSPYLEEQFGTYRRAPGGTQNQK
ncbi:MAG: 2OG-Fe(II) oxygenase [Alphaproteobacteria bacterium]|nr:2OG-Fe(II) oxygenase [Alphaproteobacteria bacterium]